MKEQIKEILTSYGVFHNPRKLEQCVKEIYFQGEAIDHDKVREVYGQECFLKGREQAVNHDLSIEQARQEGYREAIKKSNFEINETINGFVKYTQEAPYMSDVEWRNFMKHTLCNLRWSLIK